MKPIWIIDAGHGGIDKSGVYTTDPKIGKKFTFEDGHTIYEGVINRAIAGKVEQKLKAQNTDYIRAYDPILDWSLNERVQIANKAHKGPRPVCYIAIHSNAGGGEGNEIFTSRGDTLSDDIAQVFAETYKERFKNRKFRADISDGDLDKEADYTVLTKTKCPAILIENLFFDNRAEADYLESEKGQEEIANAIVRAIQTVEAKGLLTKK